MCVRSPAPHLTPTPTFPSVQGTARVPPSSCQTPAAVGRAERSPSETASAPLQPRSSRSLPWRPWCPPGTVAAPCPQRLADPTGTARAAAAAPGGFEPSREQTINQRNDKSGLCPAASAGAPGGARRRRPGAGRARWGGRRWRCGVGRPHGPCVGQDGWQQFLPLSASVAAAGRPSAGCVQVRGPGGSTASPP